MRRRTVGSGDPDMGVPPRRCVGGVRVIGRVTVESFSRKGFREGEVDNLVKVGRHLESACQTMYRPAAGPCHPCEEPQ